MIKLNFSQKEKKDLFKAWLAISLAFGIVLSKTPDLTFEIAFIVSGVTVGLGFLLHELAHRFLAKKYGCLAEFRSFDNMLILAVVMSFFGFIFVAPGAVFISGYVNKEKNGKISLAGPLTNLILAVFFLVIFYLFQINLLIYGFKINAWLALFNLLPFFNLDGSKVLRWNKKIYYTVLTISAILILI